MGGKRPLHGRLACSINDRSAIRTIVRNCYLRTIGCTALVWVPSGAAFIGHPRRLGLTKPRPANRSFLFLVTTHPRRTCSWNFRTTFATQR